MTAPRPTVRVGLIGAGFVAHIHGLAYQHVRGVDVELACVTASRPARAQAYAKEFKVARVAADFRAVLADPDVDLVDLCVPPHHHAPMAIEAARAGKHVIVEKPLTGFLGPAPPPPAGTTPPARPVRLPAGGRAGRRAPRGGGGPGRDRCSRRAALLRRELGLRATHPEGAPA